MLDSIVKVIRGIVRLRGATDNTLIGNVGDRLKVIDQDAVTAINNVTLAIGGGAVNIFKKNELAVSSRSETDLSGTTYAVPSGKTFAVTSFSASYDAQASMYIRLKKQTNGVGAFETILRLNMMSGGQGNSTISFALGNGVKIGVAGDVFKITIEASIIKGTVWASYSGSEV